MNYKINPDISNKFLYLISSILKKTATNQNPTESMRILRCKLPVNQVFYGLILSVLVSSCTVNKSLFNGKDLNGWKVYGTEKWYVENDQIICESGPDAEYGYLGTEKNYKNFILELEFKQEADGNSGVFIRSTVDGVKVSGWQVEVAPPGQHSGGTC